jgi:hypothetical protein
MNTHNVGNTIKVLLPTPQAIEVVVGRSIVTVRYFH